MDVSALGSTCLAVVTLFFLIAVLSVGLRIWAFYLRGREWKIADTLVSVSTLFQCGLITTLYTAVIWGGLGHHMSEVSFPMLSLLFKSFVGQSVTWVIATTLIKLSVLFFYLDVFRFSKTYRWLIYGFINFITLYGIASILCVFTICRPFPKTWNPEIPGTCGNIMSAMFATAVINCVEDLIVVIIPLPVIWSLQMDVQKKLGLSALIGIGLAIFGINIARLALASPNNDSDPSYNLAYQALFINLEVHIGLINACLPMIKSLFVSKKPVPTPSAYISPSGYIVRSKNGNYTPISSCNRMAPHEKHVSQSDTFETELISRSERYSSR